MGPEVFDGQTNHLAQQNLTYPAGPVSDVSVGVSGAVGPFSGMFPCSTVQSSVSYVQPPPPAYYLATPQGLQGLQGGSPPLAPTTSAPTTAAAPWQSPTTYLPTAMPATPVYGAQPKPEMTFLVPVCIPSGAEVGHVTTSVGGGNGNMVSVSPTSTSPGVNPLMNSTNMEVVWHGRFNELFSAFPHRWTLKPTESPVDHANVFKDSAKVRFLCKHCGNAWTSMKGRVIFWIQFSTGTVFFKLFGQQCQKCMPGTFEHSMWYPEEVHKVVANVFNRVGQLYYGFQTPVLSVTRRTGRPRTQHNSKLCQACAMNICREGFNLTPTIDARA